MAGELILIVEDNEKNMKLLRDVLGHHGYRTLEAVTGFHAASPTSRARTTKSAKMTLMSLSILGCLDSGRDGALHYPTQRRRWRAASVRRGVTERACRCRPGALSESR